MSKLEIGSIISIPVEKASKYEMIVTTNPTDDARWEDFMVTQVYTYFVECLCCADGSTHSFNIGDLTIAGVLKNDIYAEEGIG